MRIKYTHLLLFLLMASFFMHAQHGRNYSQYMFNGLLLNPAYAGSHDALNITALYRKQWAGIDGSPQALSLGAHTPLKNKKLNLGLTIEKEQVGLYNQTQGLFIYAYRLPLKKGSLSLGLQAGVNARSFNRNQLLVRDQDDPTFMQTATSNMSFMAGSGIYYLLPNFYLGIAAPDMIGGTTHSYKKMQLHSGALIPVGEEVKVKPSLLLRQVPGSPLFINLAATGYYREVFGLGAGYTINSAWLVFIDWKLNDQLNFGYAFETSTGKISTYNSGTHEVMIRYLFRYRIQAINPRYF